MGAPLRRAGIAALFTIGVSALAVDGHADIYKSVDANGARVDVTETLWLDGRASRPSA